MTVLQTNTRLSVSGQADSRRAPSHNPFIRKSAAGAHAGRHGKLTMHLKWTTRNESAGG